MESKTFCLWTETPTPTMTCHPDDSLRQQWSQTTQMTAGLFVTDIPEEVSHDQVMAWVRIYADTECGHPGETLKSGFVEAWPIDIRDEFRQDSQARRLCWLSIAA